MMILSLSMVRNYGDDFPLVWIVCAGALLPSAGEGQDRWPLAIPVRRPIGQESTTMSPGEKVKRLFLLDAPW